MFTNSLRNIYCIGRNYGAHAKELGNEIPESPIVFLKPTSALQICPTVFVMPADLVELEPEVEVVIAMGKKEPAAMAVGLDWTDRRAQTDAKKNGLPWTLAKARTGFASVGPWVPYRENVQFSLYVNHQVRQSGSTADMIFDFKTLYSFLKSRFDFQEGDILFTGTPKGVTGVKIGDSLSATLAALPSALNILVK